LAVVLVIALDRFTGAERSVSGRRRYWGTLLLIAEVLVVLASAFHRLTLYESAYGYTTLRLYVQAYLVGIAITLLFLAREVVDAASGFDARRAARRTGVAGMAFLVAFSFANPEGWVVARNMERYRAMGEIDGWYLAGLSSNAVPAVLAALPELPVLCAAKIRWHIGSQNARYLDRAKRLRWYEWNLRRARGLAAIRAANIESPNGYEGISGASLCSTSPAKHWLMVPPNNKQTTPADTAADSLKAR
jgi:two-component system sensor histidine kinase BaeS